MSKVGLFGLLLLFCILFGVSLASSGMERIQGPQPSSKAAQESAVKTPPGKVTTVKGTNWDRPKETQQRKLRLPRNQRLKRSRNRLLITIIH